MKFLNIICKQNRAIILASGCRDLDRKLWDINKWEPKVCTRMPGEDKETFITRACKTLGITNKQSIQFIKTEPWA